MREKMKIGCQRDYSTERMTWEICHLGLLAMVSPNSYVDLILDTNPCFSYINKQVAICNMRCLDTLDERGEEKQVFKQCTQCCDMSSWIVTNDASN